MSEISGGAYLSWSNLGGVNFSQNWGFKVNKDYMGGLILTRSVFSKCMDML